MSEAEEAMSRSGTGRAEAKAEAQDVSDNSGRRPSVYKPTFVYW
jgi:hypothetical protein